MIDRQDALALIFGLLAALPGLAAFLVLARRGSIGQVSRAEAKAAALEHQVAVLRQILDQMQQQVTAQQGNIRFLVHRVDELEASREREYADMEAMRQENEALRQENEALRQEVAELRRGVTELFRQMDEAKMTPAWQPAPQSPVAKRPTKGSEAAALRKKIVAAFSLRELADLAFELGVDPDEVAGDTATERARALVTYMQDRGRLTELADMCRSLRPDGGF